MVNLVSVEPIALLPTQAGCAVFLGNGDKCILFYIDPAVGIAINMAINQETSERPLTHDLFKLTLDGLGAHVSRVVIIDHQQDIYYARLFIEAKNETLAHKILEIDSRPSDAIALALRFDAPIYFTLPLWNSLPDMTDILNQMNNLPDEDA